MRPNLLGFQYIHCTPFGEPKYANNLCKISSNSVYKFNMNKWSVDTHMYVHIYILYSIQVTPAKQTNYNMLAQLKLRFDHGLKPCTDLIYIIRWTAIQKQRVEL